MSSPVAENRETGDSNVNSSSGPVTAGPSSTSNTSPMNTTLSSSSNISQSITEPRDKQNSSPNIAQSNSSTTNQDDNGNPCAPKVPPLRIVLSNTSGNGTTSSSTPASSTSSVSSSTGESGGRITNSDENSQSKSLAYVVSSSTSSSTLSNNNNAADDTSKQDDGNSNNSVTDGSRNSGGQASTNVSSSGRVTRSSQRAAQLQQTKTGEINSNSNSEQDCDQDNNRRGTSQSVASNSVKNDASSNDGTSDNQQTVNKEKESGSKDGTRKRKNRHKQGPSTQHSHSPKNISSGNSLISAQESLDHDDNNDSTSSPTSAGSDKAAKNSNSSSPGCASGVGNTLASREFQMPSYNCYRMYLTIRKQIDKRRTLLSPVHPKPPQGFKDYLLNRGSYLLEGRTPPPTSTTSLQSPNSPVQRSPPNSLEPGSPLHSLFLEQEKTRQNLRIQHIIEKDRLKLSAEQEVLRVHTRAALALANQSLPLSFCSVLKDEEIYNVIESDSESSNDNLTASALPVSGKLNHSFVGMPLK